MAGRDRGDGDRGGAGLPAGTPVIAGTVDAWAEAVSVGGGTTGGLWTQIVSDGLGQEQILPTYAIGACYGDALLAGLAVGLVDEATAWNPPSGTVRPDPVAGERYDRVYPLHRALYESTRDIVHALNPAGLSTTR